MSNSKDSGAMGVVTRQASWAGLSENAVDQLKALTRQSDPYRYSLRDIGPLQLQAMHVLFEQRRRQIVVLDQRAKDLGIEAVNTLGDVLPLLFAHQTYKSYPDTFVSQNKWNLMNRWLGTLSTRPVGNIDVSGISSIDEWIAQLSRHDHHLMLSSGTSGKASFLDRNQWDVELTNMNVVKCLRLTQEIAEDAPRRPVFLLGPKHGTHIFVGVMHAIAAHFGRPDATYWLSDLALTETDLKMQGELRRKVLAGTATPGEIQALEAQAKSRQEHMQKAIRNLAVALAGHAQQPIMLVGLWLPHFLLMEEARKLGLRDGALHPDSSVLVGGGLKGAKLPSDFREQIERFHGLAPRRYHRVYGMVELSAPFLGCEAGRYHCPPWVVPLILDEAGEVLLNRADGCVEGRFAFFDVATEGRWGGVITGDKVDMDFNGCPCGRNSPSVKSIVRYTDLKDGDDKLSCAGTMASYVRGVIEE